MDSAIYSLFKNFLTWYKTRKKKLAEVINKNFFYSGKYLRIKIKN